VSLEHFLAREWTRVREIRSEDELDRLEKILPREAFEAAFMLAAGYSVEEARTELGSARQAAVDTTDSSRTRSAQWQQFIESKAWSSIT